MDKENIRQLVIRFNSGQTSADDELVIERLLESGKISLEELAGPSMIEEQVMHLHTPAPRASLDHRFYQMLEAEKSKQRHVGWRTFFTLREWGPKLAIASVTLILGLAVGYYAGPGSDNSHDQQIRALSEQVSDLQEMMMLSLLEKGSATERLKAVNLSREMSEASRKVTAALIQTLNEDDNVNVRLAALEALKPYATDSSVREALIRSIGQQESPLVQVSLAELMVALQEKSAVKEMEKIIQSEKTPADVKKKIKESIDVLI